MQQYQKKGVCPYDCPDACGFLANTDGKKIFSVKGDPLHPTTKGFLCRKMCHYEQDVHDSSRILTPLKRIGPKGKASSFVPISWEAAGSQIYDTWSHIIKTSGATSILPYSFAGTMGILQRQCGEAFFHRLGAAKLSRTICCNAKDAGFIHAMGQLRDWNTPQLATADCIILWGANPKVNQLHTLPWILEAKKNGAKIILIDLYEHHSSTLCDEVILVKPGTDAALILAMMHELDQNDWLNTSFIEQYTTGFSQLSACYKNWTPEQASHITGVSAASIRKLARDYGTASRSLILTGNGMSRYTNSSASFHLLFCLPALTGAWAKGGGTSGVMGSSDFIDKTYISRPDFLREEVPVYNMNQLGLALTQEEHPIKSLYVYHSNPAVMAPDQTTVLRGLKREDLFMVVHDRYLTDTALYADLVLPATFSVEQDDLYASYGHYHLQAGWKILDPPGLCKSNWDTFQFLAKFFGWTDEYWNASAKEFIDARFEHMEEETFFRIPLSSAERDALQKGEPILLSQADVMDFQTSDKRIHLAPLGGGYVPLSDQKHALRLVMVHSPWTLNSNFSYRAELSEKRGPLSLRIHPTEAEKRGLHHQELCIACNSYGKVTVQLLCSVHVPPGTAIAEGVYHQSDTFDGYNFSALTGEQLTDHGMAAPLNTYTIELRKKGCD